MRFSSADKLAVLRRDFLRDIRGPVGGFARKWSADRPYELLQRRFSSADKLAVLRRDVLRDIYSRRSRRFRRARRRSADRPYELRKRLLSLRAITYRETR
ncbi:hypothetical protein B0H17DRAFT_1210479 [Mycena rosella]|uniref:Uncharacterized protein n=1 Tax=Mycena rosella TaxID=1033263 RepID=A0AAD7G8T6_MYCRO|nr:hypothetical protein B0H17DRAFT_1210479 [Mycena rosella]